MFESMSTRSFFFCRISNCPLICSVSLRSSLFAGFAAEGREGSSSLAAERPWEGFPLWHGSGPDEGVGKIVFISCCCCWQQLLLMQLDTTAVTPDDNFCSSKKTSWFSLEDQQQLASTAAILQKHTCIFRAFLRILCSSFVPKKTIGCFF